MVLKQRNRIIGHQPFTPFQVGDKAWLDGKNLQLSQPTAKLGAWHFSPFKVTKVISLVMYRLELPPLWKVFDTFHASLLSSYKKMEQHGANFLKPPPEIIKGVEEYEVKAILGYRVYGW